MKVRLLVKGLVSRVHLEPEIMFGTKTYVCFPGRISSVSTVVSELATLCFDYSQGCPCIAPVSMTLTGRPIVYSHDSSLGHDDS